VEPLPLAPANPAVLTGPDIVASKGNLNDGRRASVPPILADKDFAAASVFEPANLLREARRQKRLQAADVPDI
jgi:hypothetical protein